MMTTFEKMDFKLVCMGFKRTFLSKTHFFSETLLSKCYYSLSEELYCDAEHNTCVSQWELSSKSINAIAFLFKHIEMVPFRGQITSTRSQSCIDCRDHVYYESDKRKTNSKDVHNYLFDQIMQTDSNHLLQIFIVLY